MHPYHSPGVKGIKLRRTIPSDAEDGGDTVSYSHLLPQRATNELHNIANPDADALIYVNSVSTPLIEINECNLITTHGLVSLRIQSRQRRT